MKGAILIVICYWLFVNGLLVGRHGGIEAEKLEGQGCDHMLIAKSILLFITAGLCEIGGGYLIWIWLREGKTSWFAVAGAIILILYGIVPTFQPANFGRVYAAYGGIFVVLSIFWGWKIDHIRPDRFDLIGGLICLIGVCIIMYWPRGSTPVG